MKEFMKGINAKKIIALLLIIATIMSYFPMGVFADGDEDESNDDIVDMVDLSVAWTSGDEVQYGLANSSYAFQYVLKLNRTQFKNVNISVTTDEVEDAYDYIRSSNVSKSGYGYAIISYGNIDTGRSLSDNVSVTFGNDKAWLDRTVTIIATGKYKDKVTQDYVPFSIKKVLNANIKPYDSHVTPYHLNLAWSEDGWSRKPSYTLSEVVLGKNQYGKSKGWYATSVNAKYPIYINSEYLTQKLDLKITLGRYTYKGDETINSTGLPTIDWGGLNNTLGEPTVTDNNDGTVTYLFSKGAELSTLDRENAFRIDRQFDVTVKWQTPNTNPETMGNEVIMMYSKAFCNIELSGEGFKVTKEWGKDAIEEKVEDNDQLYDSDTTPLFSYTPGTHAWISLKNVASGMITDKFVNILKTNRTIDLGTTIQCTYVGGDLEDVNGTVKFSEPTLRYITDQGDTRTITLNSNQIRIKSVTEYKDIGSKYSDESNEYDIDGTYNVTDNNNAFSIVMPNFLNNIGSIKFVNYGLGGDRHIDLYHLTYTLNADELGLTDTELDNIQEINFGMRTVGSRWINGGGETAYKKQIVPKEVEYSYMDLSSANLDTTASMQGKKQGVSLSLRMFRDNDALGDDTEETIKYVVNKNPVFYVSLPKQFKYDNIDVDITPNNYITIDEENMDLIKVNGVQYLVIPCIGTYDSRKNSEVDITISYQRTLINGYNQECTQSAIMITENENYVGNEISNVGNFSINGEQPDTVFFDYVDFNVVGGSELKASTTIVKDEKQYQIDGSNTAIEPGEKEQPILIDSGESFKIRSVIEAYGDKLDNIKMITRLPFKDNVNLYDSTRLIEDNYKLPDSFYTNYGSKVRGNTQGNAVKQLTNTSVKILGVYIEESNYNNSIVKKVSSDLYHIYSSTNETADFETDMSEFTECSENTILTNAKTIKVEFNEGYKLNSGEKIYIEYESIMPDEEGMGGTETAVQYTRTSNNAQEILYSGDIYIINGSEKSDLIVTKKFENYAIGTAPEGVSLEGIEFKLQYYDEIAGEKKFLQDSSNHDISATTNAEGKATFTNIPAGDYYLYEVTTFEKYSGIGNINLINVEPSKIINYTATNYLKRGDIVINKQWDDTNDNQGETSFKIERVNETNESFNFTPIVVSTVNGVATATKIPYGKYKITEKEGINGWAPEVNEKQITLGSPEQPLDYLNIPGKGILQIVKTVPQGQTVEGLSFRITGRGEMSYTNKEGVKVNTNTDMTVRVSDESQPENVSVDVSNDKTTATITISNLYLGYYYVEEVDIPTFENSSITKYASAFGDAIIAKHDLVNPVVISLENNYKYGYIEINKKAKLKEGDNYTEIGDLSEFKVHVTGTSDYGNEVDSIIQLDEDGYGVGRFEIGEYTVTEVPVDGYNVYYGESNQDSTEPVTIRVQEGRKVTQKLYNEHTGIGYVRVEKSLETVTDPQKVVNAGIRFAVVGKNVAGADVNEVIEINQIDQEKNVAYGISGPISSGGEYELQEISVPEFYTGAEPQSIEITTENTFASPLVKTVTNTRDKGNLEIVTTTNPEGGPLKGITYKVTEVDIDANGIYTPIEGTTITVEGSNYDYNASFAKLENIYSGYYLVEQDDIPAGWIKDVSQVVEVPSENTGYANFEITEKKKLNSNKVTINKVVLNEDGEEVTQNDLVLAKLEARQSFEVKITNIDTLEEYYVFISDNNPGVIQGLDVGTYKIEEVFKPKYEVEGYYTVREIPNPITEADPLKVEEKITSTEDSYLFTITEEGNTVQDVTLLVKNQINTDYGFAGQNQIDNYGKAKADEEQITFGTKAVIYVVDEEGNAISGVKFNLTNSEGRIMTVNNNSEISVNNKRLTVRGLPIGVYKLKCIQVPTGYLVPDDEQVVVYSDATQVARVEIQKNNPRGSLTLSTVYSQDDGTLRNVSRSKYKVVDKETGDLVKFVRTPTGNYKKSNLEDASPLVIVKSGNVKLDGIETGDYEVGIVDVTKGYGIKKTTVEDVSVQENENQVVQVEVVNHGITQIDAGSESNMYINDDGELYFNGLSRNGALGNGDSPNYTSMFTKVEFPVSGIKIKKVVHTHDGVAAIDTDGRAWLWGSDYFGSRMVGNVYVPQCITESGILSEVYYGDHSKFIDIEATNSELLLLDDKGRVWAAGNYNGNGSTSMQTDPYIITRFNNIKISKLGKIKYRYNTTYGVIDELGRVWTWGSNNYLTGKSIPGDTYIPFCISEQSDEYNPTAPLEGVVIKDLLFAKNFAMAIDSEGNLWMWGTSGLVQSYLTYGTKIYPTKIDSSFFGGAKIKEIAAASDDSGSSDIAAVIDEYGRVWTWGAGGIGELGNGTQGYSPTPICISDDETEMLYGVEMKNIDISDKYSYASTTMAGYHIIALDTNNRIWAWGGFSEYEEIGTPSNTPITTPRILDTTYNEHFEYNLRYKKVFGSIYDYNKIALDDEGRVWVWGDNRNSSLGIFNRSTKIKSPIVLEIPGNPKIIKVACDANENTLFLSDDGRVFIAGRGYIGDGTQISAYASYGIGVTEITDNFSLPANVKIVDINESEESNVFMAIDSEGKVYTWGNESLLGRTTSSNALKIECISDDANEVLKGVRIKKVASVSNALALAISEDGKLYAWNNSVPQLVPSNVKFVDAKRSYLIDENGKLWKCSNSYQLECISDIVTGPLYKKHQTDPKYKIVELSNNYYTGSYITIKDSNGDWWVVLTDDVRKFNVNVKDIISLSCRTCIDKYGQLWEIDGNGVGTCLSNNTGNIVYNIKMKRVISDGEVADEQGNKWHFWSDYAPKIDGISPKEYVEYNFGVEIIDNINEEFMLDNQGKIWSGTVCISDKENTQLANAYNDSNFKITNIYKTRSLYIALANDGSVWQWEAGEEPTRLIDSSGNLLEDIQSIELSSSSNSPTIIAKNNNGKVWLWGANSSSQVGDGSTLDRNIPYCINVDDTEGKKIKDIKVSPYNSIMLCEDNSVYITGSGIAATTINQWTYSGNCDGADNVFISSNYRGTLLLVSGNNKVWAFGYNGSSSNLCGTGNTTDDYISTPTLISEEFTVKELARNYYGIGVIDTNGIEWIWGNDGRGPHNITSVKRVTYIRSGKDCAITEQGHIYSNKNDLEYVDCSNAIKDIYGELSRENILKVAKVLSHDAYSGRYEQVLVNGKLWELYLITDMYKGTIISSYRCLNSSYGSEMNGKYIVDFKDHKAIDSDGNLYVWAQNTGLNYNVSYPKNITKTESYNDSSNMIKANNVVINNPIENGLYGLKIKELINDKFVIDENDNVWYFTISGNAVNISEEHKGDNNPLFGKQFKRKINDSYIVTTDNEIWYIGSDYPGYVRQDLPDNCEYIYDTTQYSIGLKDGKIWTCGLYSAGMGNGDYTTNGVPVCLNDIEGTELYNAQLNDPNFKITKIMESSSRYLAVDNSGKLWGWGRYKKAETEGNYELSPVCFTDIEGTKLYDAYYNQNITVVGIDDEAWPKDSNGALWAYDYDSHEFVYYSDYFTYYEIPEDGVKLVKECNNMLLGTNGSLYFGYGRSTYEFVTDSVKDIICTYSEYNGYSSSYYYYYRVYYVLETDGLYRIEARWKEDGSTHALYDKSIRTYEVSNIDNVVEMTHINSSGRTSYYMLRNEEGDIAVAAGSGVQLISSIDSPVVSIEVVNDTVLITDSNNNLYACEGLSSADLDEPSLYTEYDEIITEIYGEATNETRKDFTKQMNSNTKGGLIVNNHKTYKVETKDSQTVCTEVNLAKKYINGLGIIQNVVGEYEVLSDDGRIFRLTPDGTTSYTLTEVEEATEFTTKATVVTNPEDASINVDGKTIVKQSPHKALDSEGNLYVWDEYTGLTTYEQENGTINLTEKEYDVEPIYLRSNGWSIIKSSY